MKKTQKIKVELPSSLEDLPLGKYSKIKQRIETAREDYSHILEVVAIVSGVDMYALRQGHYRDVLKMYSHILNLFTKYVTQEKAKKEKQIQKKVEIEGKTYVFSGDTSNWNAAQWMDANKMRDRWKTDHSEIAAIMYIEEGLTYGQEDEDGRTLNPLQDRKKIFRDHFPTSVFLDMEAFFLPRYERLLRDTLGRKEAKKISVRSLVENMETILLEIVENNSTPEQRRSGGST